MRLRRNPLPRKTRFSRESVRAGRVCRGPSSSARRLPDALKFANGLLRQKKYDLAAEEYERFANSGAKGKDLDDARFGLANARLYQGNFREARQAFDEFLKGAPEDPRRLTARYRLGELAYLLGDLPAARQSLEEFTAATSDHAGLEMALTYLGDTCFGLQDLPQARGGLPAVARGVSQGRLAERAKYGLGRTLAALGERDRALALMQELTKQAQPRMDRQGLAANRLDPQVGRAVCAKPLKRSPRSNVWRPEARSGPRPSFSVRWPWCGSSVPAEAEPLLKSLAAEGAAPQGARAALELATIELERNQPDAAMTTLESGLKRFPESPLLPAMHFRAAEVLQKQNHLEEAQARFERVVESNPNDPWADDAQERAAQVGPGPGRPGGGPAPGRYVRGRFPQSPLKPEVRLIEARAAAQQGKHDEAVAMLKSLVAPPADARPRSPRPHCHPP